MSQDLIYQIEKSKLNEKSLKTILTDHSEIKFISLVGVDLAGHETDEKIPVNLFLDDITGFLKGSVQTDGSSVVLPGIASLNNAKIDMIADLNVNWFVDYNYELIEENTNKPVGTLRIPCFLLHENIPVDSRHILKSSIDYSKSVLLNIFKNNEEILSMYNLKFHDIDDILFTSATELEFWVKTPNDNSNIDELSTSQVLHEQYWGKTRGAVRTALEETLLVMDKYNLGAEMGHKEVGGVTAKLTNTGDYSHIMEQIEVDFKYADAVQAADNESVVKLIVRETFRKNGLEVTFHAKPIDGVAGNGEHTHLSLAIKTRNGKIINLFAPTKEHFLSKIGYGSLMGVLKNYEVLNPIVSGSNASLKRLKPGFEAPVCIVTSLGHSVDMPSRNRSILLGVIRDLENPLSTRFELRAPNPHSNTYLVLASMFMASLDGIEYAITKTEDELLKELSKKADEEAGYLEKEREYRSEKDVFEEFTEEERTKLFGRHPRTVFENLQFFELNKEKLKTLKKGGVFSEKILNSYKIAMTNKWLTEINHRIFNKYMAEVRGYKKLHAAEFAEDIDIFRWQKIAKLRKEILKDTMTSQSIFTRIKENTENGNYGEVSNLQVLLDSKLSKLRELYSDYSKNLLLDE